MNTTTWNQHHYWSVYSGRPYWASSPADG
jgi:hypothetical protein